jgi:uncharacterized membrane protein HdeD (DUF308 family)
MSTQNQIEEVRKRAGWSIFTGVLTAALGVFLIVYPLATAKITTVLLGWVLILVAIAQFAFALHSRKPGGFFTRLLAAALFLVTGGALAFAPMASVQALTGLLGTLLLVQAGLAIITAFQIRPLAGWPWYLVEAPTSFALGLLILIEWPSSSVWAIGMLVGVAVLMGGIVRIVFATKIQNGARTPEPLSRSGAGMSSEPRNTQGSAS